MPGELVQFDEGTGIEQGVDALAGGLLTLGVLAFDRSRRPRVNGFVVAALQVGKFAGRRVWIGRRSYGLGGHERKLSAPDRSVGVAYSWQVISHIRLPLDSGVLRQSLQSPWTRLDVVDITESTNADLAGAPAGSVLAAEFQQAGRGRLDRSWSSPPRAGLTFSVAVCPPVAPARWGWLALLTGVATCAAVEAVAGVATTLKWPNDVLAVDGGKLAGILAQAVGANVVIGVGLNVSTTSAELAVPTATSLALAGARTTDRTLLLEAILAELGATYLRWTSAGGDAASCGLIEDYRRRCSTIGQDVAVSTADGVQSAHADGIDEGGRLLVRLTAPGVLGDEGEQRCIAAADIVHLRTSGHAVS